jgi:hypothetical protein
MNDAVTLTEKRGHSCAERCRDARLALAAEVNRDGLFAEWRNRMRAFK